MTKGRQGVRVVWEVNLKATKEGWEGVQEAEEQGGWVGVNR